MDGALIRCSKCQIGIVLGLVLLWPFIADAAKADVHEVKITPHVTFSPLVLQMRSGDQIRFCDESGLYIKPYYFPFDGLHPPPNDLVRLGSVPPHECMTTDPILLPPGSKGRRVPIFSEIQSTLKLIVGLYPSDTEELPPLLDDPFAEEPILGQWKACDRIVEFTKEDSQIVGRYVKVADLSQYGFKENDVSHQLVRSAADKYRGTVVWKFVETTADGKEYSEQEKATVVTVQGDHAHDSGADSCGRKMTRVSAQ